MSTCGRCRQPATGEFCTDCVSRCYDATELGHTCAVCHAPGIVRATVLADGRPGAVTKSTVSVLLAANGTFVPLTPLPSPLPADARGGTPR